jgi:hypothetical protein
VVAGVQICSEIVGTLQTGYPHVQALSQDEGQGVRSMRAHVSITLGDATWHGQLGNHHTSRSTSAWVRPGKCLGKAGLTQSGTCLGRTRVKLWVTRSGTTRIATRVRFWVAALVRNQAQSRVKIRVSVRVKT